MTYIVSYKTRDHPKPPKKHPKPAKTTQNHPKQATQPSRTSHNQPKLPTTTQNHAQSFKTTQQ